jgi:hypothetical protein
MWPELGLNILGGFLASVAFSVVSFTVFWTWRRTRGWQFKQVFGPGVFDKRFSLIYDELALRNSSDSFAYVKPGGDPGWSISTSRSVPVCTARALNYLASVFGSVTQATPAVRSDVEAKSQLDLDFVSFGGPGVNHKTADCQSNSGNRLAAWDQDKTAFVRLSDGKPMAKFEAGFDYGLILKVRPSQFPNRVWIACIGLREWGTSGAAWFLANKWKEIRREAGDRPFAFLVRVKEGQDQSGEIVSTLADKT